MPTKAQLLELNAGLVEKNKDLEKAKSKVEKQLTGAQDLAKQRVASFNEMKKSNSERGARLDKLSTTVRSLETEIREFEANALTINKELDIAKSDAARFKKRIPWWKSKK